MKVSAKTAIAVWIVVLIALVIAAAKADTYSATTDVYVRNIDGSIAGSLYTGDGVEVTGFSGGWANVEINGNAYKVWSEFLTINNSASASGIRKSKSMGEKKNGVYTGTVKKHRIKGSSFEGLGFW